MARDYIGCAEVYLVSAGRANSHFVAFYSEC
jgi:hypothetical protein